MLNRLFAFAAVLLLAGHAIAGERAVVAGRTDPQTGVAVQCDLPDSHHLKNLPNGGGCCVYASMDMTSDYHRIKPLIGVLQDRLGGAGPSDVDRVIARRYPGYKNYVQAVGASNSIALMDWALRNGHYCCVTYGYGERYGGTISHCVCLVHLDAQRACVQDNNFPTTYEWMSRTEFLRRHAINGGNWSFCFLEPPPIPIPAN
jgi:hypothetical protein